MRPLRGHSRMASTFSTTCPQSDASAMPAAVRTIYSSPIRQSAGIQVECRTALKKSILRAPVNSGQGTPPRVVRGGRRSWESTGSSKTTAFQGSILGGADQADSCLSFVVPLLELILGDSPRIDNRRSKGLVRNLHASAS